MCQVLGYFSNHYIEGICSGNNYIVGEVLQFYQEPDNRDNKHDQFAVALKSSAGVGNENSVVALVMHRSRSPGSYTLHFSTDVSCVL